MVAVGQAGAKIVVNNAIRIIIAAKDAARAMVDLDTKKASAFFFSNPLSRA
jgi:hypothetical protein